MSNIDKKEAALGINTENFQLLGIRRAAGVLGISHNTLRHWLCRRRFPYIKVGRRSMIAVHDLMEFVESNRVTPVNTEKQKRQ